MAHLVYPTLDLFVYDLRDPLGQKTEQLEQTRQRFAQKLPEKVRSTLFQEDDQFEAEFVELLGDQQTTPLLPKSQDYEGYYYPVRLSDTYGLLIDCSVADKTQPNPVTCFSKLKKIIDENCKHKTATLGQTWMISGQLANDPDSEQDPERIAQECYQALIPNADWKKNCQGKGHFLGGTIFELWQYNFRISEKLIGLSSEPLPISEIENNHHLIIAIYPNIATAKKAANFIDDWMRLFCYRSKIIWAYQKSQLLKKYLKEDFGDIQEYIRLLRKKETEKIILKQLQDKLDRAQDIFSHYAIDIDYLDYQRKTIKTNLYNYRHRLDVISENAAATETSVDLEVLRNFGHHTRYKYLRQLQKDYFNLSKGLELLQVALNFIRAEVDAKKAEVDAQKAERDRFFQKYVAIIGIGVSVGSFFRFPQNLSHAENDYVKSVVKSVIQEQPYLKPYVVPASQLIYSGIAGTIAVILTWRVIQQRFR